MSPALIWFLAGLVLILAEFVLPGVVLVFIGLGAWVAALTTWLGWTPALGGQSGVFAVSSLVLLFSLRSWFKSWFMGFSDRNPDMNQNLDDYLGREVRVITAMASGSRGKVEFKGATWDAVSSENLEPGAFAIIEGMDGLCLKIKPKEN